MSKKVIIPEGKKIAQFEVVTNQEENFRFQFNFETEKKAKALLKSANFTLLSGAIQTLCNQHSLTLNDKENNINLLNINPSSRNLKS